MPLYEYECDACGRRFEVIQKFSERSETCPTCGGSVKRLLSSPAIQFKGSGWYITDYARAGKGDGASATSEKSDKSEKSDAGATGSTESKSETKAESKSESKAASKSESNPAPTPPKSTD